jgi:nitrite reductase (NADH) small subunit
VSVVAAERVAARWVRVGRPADVPLLEGRSVDAAGRRLAVFRLESGWAAIDHSCPHRGGPLSDGIVAEHCVTCPLHGQRFSLRTGRRVDGTGERVGVDGEDADATAEGVRTYEIRERDGQLEVRIEP